jgi:DNA-binding GntR family transcriptional regulator
MSIQSDAVASLVTAPADPSSGAEAHLRLRRAIVRLELPPSAPVSETSLTERFGLSRAAVRAALARLRAEGLVLAEARRGHVIAPLTLRDVREVYDLRLLVEPAGAAAAAGVLDVAAVDALVGRVRTLIDPPLEELLVVNRDVHVTVAAAAGNGRLRALVERLLDESERAIAVALRAGVPGGGPRVRDEHLAVLAALRAGHSGRAERAMADAIRSFRDDLLGILTSTPEVLDTVLR